MGKDFLGGDSVVIGAWRCCAIEGILRQEVAKQKAANQTLALAEKTDRAVREIQRTLSPLEEPMLAAYFDISCDLDAAIKHFCEHPFEKEDNGVSYPTYKVVKPLPFGPTGQLHIAVGFFANSSDSSPRLKNDSRRADWVLEKYAMHSQDDHSFDTNDVLPANKMGVRIKRSTVHIESNGTIESVQDFPGSTVVFTVYGYGPEYLTLTSFDVDFKSGQTFHCEGPFERTAGPRGEGIFKYVVPVSKN
jgi:hypothetical protein